MTTHPIVDNSDSPVQLGEDALNGPTHLYVDSTGGPVRIDMPAAFTTYVGGLFVHQVAGVAAITLRPREGQRINAGAPGADVALPGSTEGPVRVWLVRIDNNGSTLLAEPAPYPFNGTSSPLEES